MRMNMGELAQAKRKKQPAAEQHPSSHPPAPKRQKIAVGAPSASARAPPSRATAPPARAPTPPARHVRSSDDEVEVVAPPPLAIVPVSRAAPTPPASSDQAAAARERKGKAPATSATEPTNKYTSIKANVPVGASALRNMEVAEDLLKLVLLPRDVDARKDKSLDELVMSFFPGLTRMTLDISLIQEGLHQQVGLIKNLQAQVDTLKADLAASEERRSAGEAREASFQEERRKLVEERNKAVADVKNKAAEEKNTSLGMIRSLKDQLREQGEKLASEKEWASRMEIQATQSSDKVSELEKEVEALRQDIDSAGVHAVEAYKGSSDFAAKVAEGCLDSFHLGFLQCRRMVKEQFPGLDVSKLVEPEDLNDLPDVEEETVEEEPSPDDVVAERAAPSPAVPTEQGTEAEGSSELISTVTAEILAMVAAEEARAPEEQPK